MDGALARGGNSRIVRNARTRIWWSDWEAEIIR